MPTVLETLLQLPPSFGQGRRNETVRDQHAASRCHFTHQAPLHGALGRSIKCRMVALRAMLRLPAGHPCARAMRAETMICG